MALRDGDWKLVAAMDAPLIKQRAGITPADQKTIKTASLGKMELYNLKTDRAETRDVSAVDAAQFKRRSVQMKQIYASVQQDTHTWPAWEWPRYEHQRIQWPAFRGAKKVPLRQPQIPGDFRSNPLLKRP